jgi:multidrug transporter EmrE-like cation transporter
VLNLFLILVAITFEVYGDAFIRVGLRGHKPLSLLIGAAFVVVYGMTISLPKWSFSRTMGIYIAMLFIVSQIVAVVMLHETVKLPTIIGGLLIISGGVVILAWRST